MNPNLIVIAGPNGAGKTTITSVLRAHNWFEGCVYVNPDNIAQERFGDHNDPRAVLEAARYAEAVRKNCIAAHESLAFETVFSAQDKLDFLCEAKDSGYFIRLFFVGTSDSAINAKRIYQRVLEGGHEVPMSKIPTRFQRAFDNLLHAIPLVDRAYVYDNSVEHQLPALQFRTRDGVVHKHYPNQCDWARAFSKQLEQTHAAAEQFGVEPL